MCPKSGSEVAGQLLEPLSWRHVCLSAVFSSAQQDSPQMQHSCCTLKIFSYVNDFLALLFSSLSKSFNDLNPLLCISQKVFEVPSTPEQLLIPFARVNHAKYMVTDRVAYIGKLRVVWPVKLTQFGYLLWLYFKVYSSSNLLYDDFNIVFVGTSNWSENYFTQTSGVGLVVNQTGSVVEKGHQTVQNRLQKLFQRDWNSDVSQPLTEDHAEYCSMKKKL